MVDSIVPFVAVLILAAVVAAFWLQLSWRERPVPGYLTEEMLDDFGANHVPDPRSLEERIRDARATTNAR